MSSLIARNIKCITRRPYIIIPNKQEKRKTQPFLTVLNGQGFTPLSLQKDYAMRCFLSQ